MAASREKVLQTAEKLVSRGRLEAGIKEYKKVLRDHPNDISTLNRVGDLYARISKNEEAIDLFTQIAESYAEDGFFVKAIAIYKKIIKLDPTRLHVYEKLADLYHRQGLTNEARSQYQVLADYYLKHASSASAITIYQKMAELEPDNPSHHAKLAELYQRENLTDKAMGEYARIAELMLEHGHPGQAAQVYERALAVTADDLGFITDGVLKLKEAGEIGAAARFLAAAVAKNPQVERVAEVAGLGRKQREETLTGMTGPGTGTGTPTATTAPIETEPPPLEVEEEPAETPPAFEPPEPAAKETAFEVVSERPEEPSGTHRGIDVQVAGDDEGLFDHEELELEIDDDEPSSMVAPPADMADDTERRGAAWREDGEPEASETDAATPAPDEALDELETFEFELDLDADSEDLLSLPEPAPAVEAAAEPDDRVDAGFELVDGGTLAEADGDGRGELETPLPENEPASASDLDHDLLERTAAEVLPEQLLQEDDLLTEAEVLTRYGIEDKAVERLTELLRRNPRHLEGHKLLIELHLSAGRHQRVISLAGRLAELAAEAGDEEVWPAVRAHLEEQGYAVVEEGVEPPEGTDADLEAEPEPPEESALATGNRGEAAPRRFSLGSDDEDAEGAEGAEGADLDETDEDDELLASAESPTAPPAAPPSEAEHPDEPAPAPTPPPPTAPPATARRRSASDVDAALAELTADLLGGRKRRPAAAPPAHRQAPSDVPPTAAHDERPAASLGASAEASTTAPVQPAEPGGAVDPLRALGDSLRDEIDRGSPEIPVSPPAVGQAPPATPPPAAGPDVSWLDDVSKPAGQEAADEAAFFDDADFFDLGAELEQELTAEGDDELLAGSTEQSLEEIVEGFKQGVAQSLSEEDYDTHFNLGIAYREMGLLDEAIGEFQLAAKSPQYLVAAASMLGLSFREKGLPDLAIKWYRRGLEAGEMAEEDQLGLLYDLGEAHLAAGDREAAYAAYVDLYGVNSNYRDVVARLAELEPGR